MIWAILMLAMVLASPKQVIKQINKDRREYDLPKIEYNWTLHDYLKKYKDQGEWMYADSNVSTVNFVYKNQTRYSNINGVHINDGFKYFYRDTYKDSVLKIIKFRSNQKDCFDINLCSNETYNKYVSCMTKLQLVNSKKCSYANSYLPMHLIRSLKNIAILKLDYKGRFVPEKNKKTQKKSFWIYGYYDVQLSDNPLKN